MTARDLQAKAKEAGLPWTHAKGFDTFTPISDFIPKSAVPSPHNLNIWLKVDDELRQNGNTADMLHDIPFLIAYVSRIMTLEEGDLLITGTPEGVGSVLPGSVSVPCMEMYFFLLCRDLFVIYHLGVVAACRCLLRASRGSSTCAFQSRHAYTKLAPMPT